MQDCDTPPIKQGEIWGLSAFALRRPPVFLQVPWLDIGRSVQQSLSYVKCVESCFAQGFSAMSAFLYSDQSRRRLLPLSPCANFKSHRYVDSRAVAQNLPKMGRIDHDVFQISIHRAPFEWSTWYLPPSDHISDIVCSRSRAGNTHGRRFLKDGPAIEAKSCESCLRPDAMTCLARS